MVHLASVPNDGETERPILSRLQSLRMDEPTEDEVSTSVYGSSWAAHDLPRYEMPEKEMPKDVAYRLIKDDLTLDGTPTLNLVSFILHRLCFFSER